MVRELLVSISCREMICYTDKNITPARRPSAGAVPGRCGLCLAAWAHRPLSLFPPNEPSSPEGSSGAGGSHRVARGQGAAGTPLPDGAGVSVTLRCVLPGQPPFLRLRPAFAVLPAHERGEGLARRCPRAPA